MRACRLIEQGDKSPERFPPQGRPRHATKFILAWGFLCLCTATATLFGSLSASSEESKREALEHYQNAVQLFEKREFRRVADECQEATRIRRNFVEAYDLWGIALLALGDLGEAETRFKQALNYNQKHVRSRSNLSFTFYRQRKHELAAMEAREVLAVSPSDPLANLVVGLIAYLTRDVQKAVEHLGRAGPLADRSPEALFALARIFLHQQKRAAGLEILRKISVLPDLSKADQFELGRVYDDYGLYEESARIFSALMQRFPGSYETKYNLALAYFHQGKVQEAAGLLQQIVVGELRPEAYDLLAACYEELDKSSDAAQAYEKAIELDPSNEDYYLRWGQLAMDMLAYEVGIKNVLVAGGRLPSSYRIRLLLGQLYQSHGEIGEAERSFREAISLNPRYALSWALLATFFQSRGEITEALQTIEMASRENPTDYLLPYVHGWILSRSSEKGGRLTEQVETLLKKSIATNPDFVESRYLLGRLYFDKGQFEACLRELERARRITPSHYSTNLLLYRIYTKLGRTTKVANVIQDLKAHKTRPRRRQMRSLDESLLFPAEEAP